MKKYVPFSLVKRVEAELTKVFEGDKLTFVTLSDPSIIADAVKNGSPSHEALKRLNAMYARAAEAGAEAILNICSSVGDFAAACQGAYALMGVPLVRIDEEMAMRATASYDRIGVIATLSSTLEPSLRLLWACAEKQGRTVELQGVLADNAFGGGAEKDYIPRKNYFACDGAYFKVIAGVDAMAGAGIRVTVRCNVDGDNWANIPEFLNDMERRVKNKRNVTIYFAPLFQARESGRDLELYQKILDTLRYMEHNNAWHKGTPNDEQYLTAVRELEAMING